jgi:hypothetical protein
MTELEQQVEKLIAEFEEWFTSPRDGTDIRNEPIVRSEKAIMKTLIWWLLNIRGGTTLPGVVPVQEKKTDEKIDVRDPVQPLRPQGDAGAVNGGAPGGAGG